MTDTTIRKSIFLAADQGAVWDYLTKSDLLATWFHPAEADLVDGMPYALVSQKDGGRLCWGQVEEMRPHDYLRWSFTIAPLNGNMTIVEWRLEPVAGGTRLSLEHSGLPVGTEAFGLLQALDKGWHEHLLGLYQMQD